MIKLITFFCLISLVTGKANLYKKKNSKIIQDQYIVVLKKGIDKKGLDGMVQQFAEKFSKKDMLPINSFSYNGYSALHAKMTEYALNASLEDSRIEFIEQEFELTKSTIEEIYDCPKQEVQREYFLKQISHFKEIRNLPNIYQYLENAGSGVLVYVLDTGIYQAHSEFTGRVFPGPSFIKGETINDRDGHGTCSAGIIAGTSFGVAKKATIIPIKVLAKNGNGTLSSVMVGISWAVGDVRPGRKIISINFSGEHSPGLNSAIASAVAAGIPVVVGAGNDNKDVMNFSPASEPTAITVAASDSSANFASFSNHGIGVDIIAPGVAIKCASITKPDKFVYLSGTSLAAALVTGVSTTLLGGAGVNNPDVLDKLLKTIARKDYVTNVPFLTPKLLLFNGCKPNSLTTPSSTRS